MRLPDTCLHACIHVVLSTARFTSVAIRLLGTAAFVNLLQAGHTRVRGERCSPVRAPHSSCNGSTVFSFRSLELRLGTHHGPLDRAGIARSDFGGSHPAHVEHVSMCACSPADCGACIASACRDRCRHPRYGLSCDVDLRPLVIACSGRGAPWPVQPVFVRTIEIRSAFAFARNCTDTMDGGSLDQAFSFEFEHAYAQSTSIFAHAPARARRTHVYAQKSNTYAQ